MDDNHADAAIRTDDILFDRHGLLIMTEDGGSDQALVSRHGKCYRRKVRRAIKDVTQAGVPQEGTRVGPQARDEYLAQMRDRYLRAARTEKGRMLTEAVTVTGYHRKAIIRAWRRPTGRRARGPRRGRPTHYDAAVVRALRTIWTAAGYPWSLRLKALLPTWLPWARRRLALSSTTEAKVRAISARQIDRLLAPDKRSIRRRLYGRTKPGTLLKHHIPIKTDHWDVTEPGFTEVDLVSHSGDRADGDFLHTLNVTDIHTTWVEHGAVLGKSQVRVQERLADCARPCRSRCAGSTPTTGPNSSTRTS